MTSKCASTIACLAACRRSTNSFSKITLGFFQKYGIEPIGFWTTLVGPSNHALTYLLKWESLEERERKWNAFQADADWIAKRAATEAEKPIVERIENHFLAPPTTATALMDPQFWLDRWQAGHQCISTKARVTPLRAEVLAVAGRAGGQPGAGAAVRQVAGSGLAAQGCACSASSSRLWRWSSSTPTDGLAPEVREHPAGRLRTRRAASRSCAATSSAWRPLALADCAGVYDRAALVALPPGMRERYVRHVYGALSEDYRGLLITLDYPQAEMDGLLSRWTTPRGGPCMPAPARRSNCSIGAAYSTKSPRSAQRGVTRLDTLVYGLRRGARYTLRHNPRPI